MKALILVGGYGTRLRPLTFTCPKPLVDFCNEPMILHQIAALVKVGVKEVVLAVNYQPEVMLRAMAEVEEKYNVKITFSIEDEPLGTAGPLALAKENLSEGREPFFVLNSDVICEFPFEELLNFHRAHGKEGTIMVTKVDDPSKFGVVMRKSPGSSEILRFVEKPKEFVGDLVNAGIYLFNASILDRIQPKPTSIEKDIFPIMASQGELHLLPLQGSWADVGQPKDFLIGSALHLKFLSKCNPEKLIKVIPECELSGCVMFHESAKIGHKCKIGPNVVIGAKCTIGDGVRLTNCVIMPNAIIKDGAIIKNSIIGWYSSVGRWARLVNTTVLGEDVHVSDEIYVNGGSVLPHKCIGDDINEPKIVM